ARCVANCGVTTYYVHDGELADIPIWNVSVLPSYRDHQLTVFGGITWRNHPTNSKFDTKTQTQLAMEDAGDVRAGPTYRLIEVGVEYAATPTWKLLVIAHQAITTDVV